MVLEIIISCIQNNCKPLPLKYLLKTATKEVFYRLQFKFSYSIERKSKKVKFLSNRHLQKKKKIKN